MKCVRPAILISETHNPAIVVVAVADVVSPVGTEEAAAVCVLRTVRGGRPQEEPRRSGFDAECGIYSVFIYHC